MINATLQLNISSSLSLTKSRNTLITAICHSSDMAQKTTSSTPRELRVATRIRQSYLLALSVIAAMSIAVFMVEYGTIKKFDSVATIVNTSGKQRMLSQRITIYGGKLASAPNEEAATPLAEEIIELRNLFESNHLKIMNLGAEYGGDDSLTDGSIKVYFGGRYMLDDRIRAFLENIDALLAAEPSDRAARLKPIEVATDGPLLIALDAAVTQFERDAKASIVGAVEVHLVMLCIVMLILLAELLLIFRPLANAVETRTRELREARDEMSHAALHDQLTGLPNRRLLNEILTTTLAQSQRMQKPMTVCHLDLDFFKAINDTHGHAVGDAVLQHAADLLRQTVRNSDFVARVGGDEFVVVDCLLGDENGAMVMANRIIEQLSKPFMVAGIECRIGASIGIAKYHPEDENLEAVMHRADIALYRAKELGRNRAVIYSAEAQETFEERMRIAA